MRKFYLYSEINPAGDLVCTAKRADGTVIGSATASLVSGFEYRADVSGVTDSDAGRFQWTDDGEEFAGGSGDFYPLTASGSTAEPHVTIL